MLWIFQSPLYVTLHNEGAVKGTSVFSYDCSGLPRLLQL